MDVFLQPGVLKTWRFVNLTFQTFWNRTFWNLTFCGCTLKYAQIPYIMACHLQIDADLDPAYHSDADPNPAYHYDADPDPTFHLMRNRMRFHNTAHYWFKCAGFCLRRTWQACVPLHGPTPGSSRTNSNCSSSSANGWPPVYPPKLTLQVPSLTFTFMFVTVCLTYCIYGREVNPSAGQ